MIGLYLENYLFLAEHLKDLVVEFCSEEEMWVNVTSI